MTLSGGTRLGPYELIAPIGAGGMGEVYRAKDTRLDRTVAVKVLPAHLSSSPESRQRFEREAKTISQLSHPHICALYDVGNQDGVEFLVMEYLEGETLSDRLLKGALPFEQVLRYGIEIADALDKAHRQGIVHRDLKPGNVMITKSGVKLLDFGLAKAVAPTTPQQLTSLPTALTQEGTILGTFQYMAPEQVEGQEADARTDIFSLGTVLYEMATGQKAFSGKTQASLIAAIIERVPPPISSISPMTPPAFDRVVKTCLAKDPEDRWQTAHDVMLELKWVAEGGSAAGLPAPVVARRKSREKLAWVLVALFAVAALVAAFVSMRLWRTAGETRTVRASVLPPPKSSFRFFGLSGAMALSPDGRFLAYVASIPEGKRILWVRPLDSVTEQALSGTEDATFPFWSPDSRYIGFFANDRLKKIAVAGGPALTICPAVDGRGGTWSRDGSILFALRNSPIYRVAETGGSAVEVTKLDASRADTSHRWPAALPDGRHFLYLASPQGSASDSNALFFVSIDGKENRKLLQPAPMNALYASRHLLYARENTLMAQPFDPDRGRFVGEAFPIAESLFVDPLFSHAAFSASENGVLAYQTGEAILGARFSWYDRTGRELGPAMSESIMARGFRLSPDDSRLAANLFDLAGGNMDIWVIDLKRGARSRLTFEPTIETSPVWSPDGTRIAYFSDRKGQPLLVKSASGTAGEEILFQSEDAKSPTSWSTDGRFLLFNRNLPKTKTDVWVLPLFGDRKPFPLVQSAFIDRNGQFSPDGRWVAYVSDESGRLEIYVVPFPGPGGKWQVSTGIGGTVPHWSADGTELFYVTGDRDLMTVEVKSGSEFQTSSPKPLFSLSMLTTVTAFEVSRDGRRFLQGIPRDTTGSPVTLVLNWTAELGKK
jgi:Tol biopolymer transport system component/predicted Ser/Thr protein kinase